MFDCRSRITSSYAAFAFTLVSVAACGGATETTTTTAATTADELTSSQASALAAAQGSYEVSKADAEACFVTFRACVDGGGTKRRVAPICRRVSPRGRSVRLTAAAAKEALVATVPPVRRRATATAVTKGATGRFLPRVLPRRVRKAMQVDRAAIAREGARRRAGRRSCKGSRRRWAVCSAPVRSPGEGRASRVPREPRGRALAGGSIATPARRPIAIV